MKARGQVLLCLLAAGLSMQGADAPTPDSSQPEHKPVTLAECYAQTLERNREIRQKRADVERAAGTKVTFTARALPRFSMQTSAGQSGGSLYDDGGPYAVVRADVSQPLFDMGIPASLRRGKLEVVIAQQNLNRTVTEQLHATRLAYLRALLSRRLYELHQQIETHLQANVRSAQQRFDVGMASRQTVRQAEIQLLGLKPQLAKAQRDYINAVTELAERKGDELATRGRCQLPHPLGKLEYAALKIDLEKETTQTTERRPDLVLLREFIKASTEDQRMVKAGYYPFVSLAALSQYVPKEGVFTRRPEIVSGQEARVTETRYGMTFTWQVIDFGRVGGQSRQIESGRQTMEITLRRLEENVPRELAVLARTLDSTDAKLDALKQSVAQAEEMLKLVESRIALKEATQLDFLNAQSNLLSTQAGILQAVYENEAARAEFDRLTGRYLDIGGRAAK